MKNIISLLVIAFVSSTMYSQSKDSLFIKRPQSIYYSFLDYNKTNYSLQFKKYNFTNNNYSFSIYNQTTKLNDLYSINNDLFFYSNSTKFMRNDFKSNKIDSFNPYGAPNFGNALVSGVLSSLFKL